MRINGAPDRDTELRAVPVDQLDLTGKRLTVIGGTNGLGRALAQEAIARGARVSVVGRTFRDTATEQLTFVKADLSSMHEAVRLGAELPVESTDVLLYTHGIFAAKTREQTAEGIERDMAISYLSRFATLRGLAPRLGTARADDAPQARVFVMAAPGTGMLGDPSNLNAEGDYSGMKAHTNTVAANEALVLAAGQRWPGPAYFGLNPGMVKTGIRANYVGEGSLLHRVSEGLIGVLAQSAPQYAQRLLPVLFAPGLDGRTGVLVNSKARPILASPGLDAARFMTASDELLDRALGASRSKG